MGYDIPPNLQHKEKIMFGLTLEQLAYALPTLILCVFLLKFNMNYYLLGSIVILFWAIASFFMFFDGRHRLISWFNYRTKKEAEVSSDVLEKVVDVRKIENGIVEKTKSKLAVLEVIPMNFMIKTDEEKESVRLGFQKFLNSLDFPLQIHISSVPINLSDHFTQAHKKVNKNMIKLFNSYCDFIRKSIADNKVKNRKFYLIIQEKDNLEIQVKVCMEKLKEIGLKVSKLNDSELLNFLNSYIGQGRKKELKKEEIRNGAHYLVAPEKVNFFPGQFIVDETFCKVLAVHGYPNNVEVGFLDKIISSGDTYDLSIHIEPYPIDMTMLMLNGELQKQQADLYSDSKKGIINPSLEIKYKSTRKILEDLQRGKQKLFNVSLYVMCRSKDENETNLLTKKVKADLNGLMIESRVPQFEMIDAYSSVLPLSNDVLKIKRNIHSEGLAAFFPFSSPFLDIENNGVLLGLNKNKIPYIKDIFSLSNANGVVLATSGSGKSYFTKLFLSRQYMNGTGVIVIDPQGEYLAIAKHYGGEIITISKNSETIINPLDLMGHDYMEKRLSLMDLFKIMFNGELTEIQKAILDKAIDLTYAKFKINRDSYKKKTPPKMQDLYDTIKALDRKCTSSEKITYRALLNRLRQYSKDGVFNFLNKDTEINFEKDFVVFNIGNMPKQAKPVVMYLVLDYVYMKMKESLNRKLLVIDEAWSLLQTAEESSYVFEIVKTCRKFNLGLLMITQDVADLVGSKAGQAVLANTSYTFLLRQKPAIISNVVRTFNLSGMEKDFLLTCRKGNGVLILENEHEELEIVASEKEHQLITTNPDEMIMQNEKKKPETNIRKVNKIELDIEQDVHSAKGLGMDENNFLFNHGYKLGSFVDIEKNSPESFLVKIRPPESTDHTFLAARIIERMLKKKAKAERFYTKKADIIFENKKGELVALEIETGKDYRKHRKRIDEKFERLKKEFGDNLHVILTDNRVKCSYEKYDVNLLLRKDIPGFINQQL